LLRHKGYIGEAHWGSSYAVIPIKPRNKERYKKMKKTSRKYRPEHEWYKIPIPAIIEKNLFMKTKLQLEESFKLCKRNTRYKYLLSGKIYCKCGKKRTGESQNYGKYLYYRCTDRILCFPEKHTCNEKGINANITDTLVWQNVTELMSSPKLLFEQINRWFLSQNTKSILAFNDIDEINKELVSLIKQENRYNEAYGTGLFTLEKLKEYVLPIRDKIEKLKYQIEKSKEETNLQNTLNKPSKEEIDVFAQSSIKTLTNLNFKAKKSIIVSVIEKVVGTQKELQVYGYIPILKQDVELCSSDRNSLNTIEYNSLQKGIPFSFNIKLPPPLKTGVDYGFRSLNKYR
jgi:site-specific DNA recombinase